MTKKTTPKKTLPATQPLDPKNLPEETKKKLQEIKEKLDKFKDQVLKKFDKYIMGITLLPPPKPKEGEKPDTKTISVLILIDDSDSKKMSKLELKKKLSDIIYTIGQDIDKNIKSQPILLSEVWQSCYDCKYDILKLIAMGAPFYDTGMLAAIKIAEVHKSMVLKKFEKYIVSYVLAGSLTQGRATKDSDIDVWIVIDDTDVKKMTRAELKDKLRAIILGMGFEAGNITGIKNKINIQVYILTDFWDNLKEANPIIFTLLRDGVPFYDRGMFLPWKQLLKMGKIKPSAEAIDMFMNSGDNMLKRIKSTLKAMAMEDTYYALLTPSQAALMLYGVPPPSPKETPELMRDIFVKKEKILEDKYITILEKNINIRKNLEHGKVKEIKGKEVDQLTEDAEKFLKRIKRLFSQIETQKQRENMIHIYDSIITIIRDVLKMEGIEKIQDAEIVKIFEDELISQGKMPAKYLRILNEVLKAKSDYDQNKLTKSEVEKVKKSSRELLKFLVEYMQRKRGKELERAKIKVKHGKKHGEVILLDKTAFIIHNIDNEDKEISKADITKAGGLSNIKQSSLEELEKHLAKAVIPPRVFIKETIFENLKDIFGKDVEVLVNY